MTTAEVKKEIASQKKAFKVAYAEFKRWESRDAYFADSVWEECKAIEKNIARLLESAEEW